MDGQSPGAVCDDGAQAAAQASQQQASPYTEHWYLQPGSVLGSFARRDDLVWCLLTLLPGDTIACLACSSPRWRVLSGSETVWRELLWRDYQIESCTPKAHYLERSYKMQRCRPGAWDFFMNFVVAGDSSVGKTSFLRRFTDGTFHETRICSTIEDFKIANICFQRSKIQLRMWDTAGQERFRRLCNLHYRYAHGIFLMYDSTDRRSFSNVRGWLRDVKHALGDSVSRVPVLLCATKCDLRADVATEEGAELARACSFCTFVKTSSKNGVGVEFAVGSLLRAALPFRLKQVASQKSSNYRRKIDVGGDTTSIRSWYNRPCCVQ